VEGDLRRLRLADYLGLEGSVGLTTVLVGQTPLTDAAMLSVICSGTLLVVRHGRAKREQVKDRRGGLTPCRRPPLRSRPEHGADEGDAYRYGYGRCDYRPREVGTEALPRTRRLKAADIVPGMRAGDGRRSVS
jgi:hypothetical protein